MADGLELLHLLYMFLVLLPQLLAVLLLGGSLHGLLLVLAAVKSLGGGLVYLLAHAHCHLRGVQVLVVGLRVIEDLALEGLAFLFVNLVLLVFLKSIAAIHLIQVALLGIRLLAVSLIGTKAAAAGLGHSLAAGVGVGN